MTKTTMGLAVALALAGGITMASDEAAACGNGTERRLHEHVMAIARADNQVSEGKPRLAAKTVLNRYPRIRQQGIGRNGVADRALKIMARAVARTKGAIDAGSRFPGATEADKLRNVQWATRVLGAFLQRAPDDATAKTDYGEILAQDPNRRAEALRVLGTLAENDLLASAHGFAALAQLRRAPSPHPAPFIARPAGTLNEARARLAEARCKRMATDDAICDGGASS